MDKNYLKKTSFFLEYFNFYVAYLYEALSIVIITNNFS